MIIFIVSADDKMENVVTSCAAAIIGPANLLLERFTPTAAGLTDRGDSIGVEKKATQQGLVFQWVGPRRKQSGRNLVIWAGGQNSLTGPYDIGP